jgi:type IV secretion system protein VirD4
LPEHEEIVPVERPVAGEFDVLDDEPDVDAATSCTMRQ